MRRRLGADRSGEGGRTASAVDGGSAGGNLEFGGEYQPVGEGRKGRWWLYRCDQRIATMNGIEAELAVAGIAAGGVADEVADSENLQDRQQQRGEQDAKPLARSRAAVADTVEAANHVELDSSHGRWMQGANVRLLAGNAAVSTAGLIK